MIFKRYLPKSLFGRTLLILAAPVVLVQAIVAVGVIQRHYSGVTQQMTSAIANEINYVVAVVEEAPDAVAAQEALARLAGPLDIRLTLAPGAAVGPEVLRVFYDVTGGAVEETLKAHVRRPLALDLVSDSRVIAAQVQTDKGVLRATVDRRRLTTANPHQIFVWMAASTVLLVSIAAVFLRNQVRPIRQLAAAADGFGKGRSVAFHPSGADEVRRAGAAFLAMRARIERQIESRTQMLSGVSHDLRSPLTRMKLALAMMEDAPEVAELQRDVAEMETMLEGFLAFARGEAGEEAAPLDPVALAEDVAASARRRGARIAVSGVIETPEAPLATLRAGAVRRALQNLLDNALTYGDETRLSVRLGARMVEFTVEDDGPGIPPEAREAALRPFTRLDAARNQDRGGGVGLGLSIAAEVARSHGGALALGESAALGGLSARLRLPR